MECDGPCDYADLWPADQHRVDQVYYNVMCYRGRREVLTPGQLDRMTDYSNSEVHHVTNGSTHFVDLDGPGGMLQLGTSAFPMITVAGGLSRADSGDIVLIRRGSYDEAMTIDQDVTLRASRGDVLVGAPP